MIEIECELLSNNNIDLDQIICSALLKQPSMAVFLC